MLQARPHLPTRGVRIYLIGEAIRAVLNSRRYNLASPCHAARGGWNEQQQDDTSGSGVVAGSGSNDSGSNGSGIVVAAVAAEEAKGSHVPRERCSGSF